MKSTDTSEKGLETLIVESFVSEAGYVRGESSDYDRGHAVDLAQLRGFVSATQPEMAVALHLGEDCSARLQFLHRLQGEIARRKIGGRARAIQYYHAIEAYLKESKSTFRAIVAFSGEHPASGRKVTEATLNGFPSAQIEKRFQQDPYRFLVVAEWRGRDRS